MKRNCTDVLKAGILAGAAVYCTVMSENVSNAVSSALERCICTLVPALYAMMILSSLLVRSGASAFIGRFADRPARIIFGMSGEEFTAFAAGTFTGYLTGAKMLCQMNTEGRLSGFRGGLLCGTCFGAGPVFISCCIVSKLYGSSAVSELILISTVSANIILALVISPFLRRKKQTGGNIPPVTVNSEILMDCTASAGRSMADVCFITAAFSVISQMVTSCGAGEALGKALKLTASRSEASANELVQPLFDVTAAGLLPAGDHTILPLICAYISFGGICVLVQLSSLCRGKFSILPVILMRGAAGSISFAVCRIISPYLLRNETVAVSALKANLYRGISPVPTVMLMIMTFMLLCTCSGISVKKGRH